MKLFATQKKPHIFGTLSGSWKLVGALYCHCHLLHHNFQVYLLAATADARLSDHKYRTWVLHATATAAPSAVAILQFECHYYANLWMQLRQMGFTEHSGWFSVTWVRCSNFAGLYHLAGFFGCRLMPLKITLKNFPPRATTLLLLPYCPKKKNWKLQKKKNKKRRVGNFARLLPSQCCCRSSCCCYWCSSCCCCVSVPLCFCGVANMKLLLLNYFVCCSC